MSKEISKPINELVSDTIKELEIPYFDINVGDIFISTEFYYPCFIKVIGFETVSSYNHPNRINFIRSKDWVTNKWGTPDSSDIKMFIERYQDNKLVGTIESYMQEANALINGETTMEESNYTSKVDPNSNALIDLSNPNALHALSNDLVAKKRHANILSSTIKYLMEKKKYELDQIKSKLDGIVRELHKKVVKMLKLIQTIDLYLGTNEDIYQLQSGENAPIDDPINLFQSIKFMDEEMADPFNAKDGGIDFMDIRQFDEWLTTNENYKYIVPYKKGICVLRVRRKDKTYNPNPFINSLMNEENKKTYIFIRNGDNLYRIWTEINIYPRLFPMKEELIKLQESTNFFNEEKKQDTIDNTIFNYKRHFIILQGLLERTDIFKPIKSHINLFDPKTKDSGVVNFVYDEELSITNGYIPFFDWRRKVNSGLKVGDRIAFINPTRAMNYNYEIEDRMDERFVHSKPDKPKEGIYKVERHTKKYKRGVRVKFDNFGDIPEHFFKHYHKEHLAKSPNRGYDLIKIDEMGRLVEKDIVEEYIVIRYKPKDRYDYDKGWVERNQRIMFKVEESDPNILNIDQVTLEEIDFYLTNRINRGDYLLMMPLLYDVRCLLVKEKESEANFVGMVYSQNNRRYSLEDIWECVEWWKQKNMWKRAIQEDDKKALRMINKRLKSNYK